MKSSSDGVSSWNWTARQVITGTLVIVGVLLVFLLIFRFPLVLFSLFEAIVFSTAITPIVDWMQKRGIPRSVGVAIVYILILSLVIGSIFLVVPLFAEQGTTILYTLQGYYRDFRQALLESPSIIIQRLAVRLPFGIMQLENIPAPEQDPFARFGQVVGVITSIFRGLFTTIAILLLTSYWSLERDRIYQTFSLMIPVEQRGSVRELIGITGDRVGAYIRGLAILSLIVGTMATIAYLLIGLPNAIFLGIIAGIMEAVPLVGPVLGAVPALMVAITIDPSKIIWIIISTIIIQLSENNLLVPRVMNKAVGVNPVVSLLAFTAFSSLFGLAGALLAIPLAVIIQIIINRLILEPSRLATPTPLGRDAVSSIRLQAQELIQDVRKQVREKEGVIDQASDQVEDAIEEIVNDLDSILAQVETVQEGKQP
ncbi:MAG TPA: AI-2E family transporter [Anaerolineaceae bacterium]|nr:AI-2E family transporter [Anaerolineaceae bacterium]